MKLENVHAGDSVVLLSNYGRNRRVVGVNRETRTMLVVGAARFQRHTGHAVGGSTFNRPSIRVPREGEVAEIREENAADLFRGWIRAEIESHLKELPATSLKRVHQLLKDEYASLKTAP